MKKVLLLIALLSVHILLHGQQRIIDSLTRLAPQHNDTLRLVHAKLLNEAYNDIDRDSALLSARQYEQLSQLLKYDINYADALRQIASSTYGNTATDLDLLFKAEKILENTREGNLLPAAYLGMLRVPQQVNTYKKYSQFILADIYMSLGLAYWSNSKFEVSTAYFARAVDIAEKLQAPGLMISCYFGMGTSAYNDDTALVYLHKAHDMALQTGIIAQLGIIEDFLAKRYRNRKDYKTQLRYLRASLQHHREQGNVGSTGWAFIGMGEYYQKNAPAYDSALYYLRNAFYLAKTLKANPKDIEYWSSRYMYEIYLERGNRDSALKFVDIMLKAKEIVFNENEAEEFESKDYLEQKQRREIENENTAYRTRVKTYSLLAGLFVFIGLAIIFWRNNKRKQKAFLLLQKQKAKTEMALQDLKSTQAQLIQSEKMASLGELTAGIAHEIQNPLNFVNNFSEINTELIQELKEEAASGNMERVAALTDDIGSNSEKINQHGKRADAIVKGMLQHSRSTSGVKEDTDINKLADEYVRLAYHGLRAKDKSFNATLKTDFDDTIGKINLVPQDIGRVILNLITNAFYAVNAKKQRTAAGYEPTVSISTKKVNDQVLIAVRDNGDGIPKNVLDKIFQPFFTTKPTGEGTGLGLSLAYDIVKAHGGELKVETKEGEGTSFIIQLLM